MPQKSPEQLNAQLMQAAEIVPPGSIFHHYKNTENFYRIAQLIIWEPTDEVAVVYRAMYDEFLTFARPLDIFTEEVEHNGSLVPRFTRVDRERAQK